MAVVPTVPAGRLVAAPDECLALGEKTLQKRQDHAPDK
jgi:hypothetical protein